MPEGPEIWRTADRLAAILADTVVTSVSFTFDRLKKFENRLTGQRIKQVEPRGKAILTRFGNGWNIYSHNQLYGKWIVVQKGEKTDTDRKLRLEIQTEGYRALLFSASEIQVLKDGQLESQPYLANLGPDILHPGTGYEEVLARYRDETFQNRSLTALLLDQGFLSGIGNYLRSEILFKAGVPPDLKLRECTEAQKKQLAGASLDLPLRSYKRDGITTDPKVVKALKREGKKREDYRHYVYGRDGQRCHICGTFIEAEKKGGRKLFSCPRCQASRA